MTASDRSDAGKRRLSAFEEEIGAVVDNGALSMGSANLLVWQRLVGGRRQRLICRAATSLGSGW